VSYADTCGQTGGRTSITKLIVALRDCANEPNITNIERDFSKILTGLKFNVTPEEINQIVPLALISKIREGICLIMNTH
jgi:hypothetical protein